MGNIGDPISSGSIPAVGTAGTTYATNLDLFLTEVKARLEAKVPRASLVAGPFDLANNPLQNATYAGLYQQTVQSGPTGSFQNIGGDVYWITATGAAKLTTGNTLNAAAIAGLTGDYGGVNPAQFRFVDVDQEYYAYDDFAGGGWARVWARNFDVATGYTGATRVRLDATGVASSYTLTLPSAPATQKLLQMGASGTVTASNVLGNNENLQLQGTGYIQRGQLSRVVPFTTVAWQVATGSLPSYSAPGNIPGVDITTNTTVLYPIALESTKEQLVSVAINMRAFTASCTIQLMRTTAINSGTTSMSAETLTGSVTSITVPADGLTNPRTMTLLAPFVPTAGEYWYISIATGATGTARAHSMTITSTVP